MPKVAFLRSLGSAAASKLGSALCGVITFGFLARALGASGLGEYRTVLTLLLFGVAVFDFGLYPLTLREIAQPEADRSRILGSAVGLRLFSLILAIPLLAVLVGGAHFDSAVRNGVLVAGIGWIGLQLNELLKAVFQFKMAQHLSAIAEISGVALSLLLVIGLSRVPVGTEGMLAATSAGFCLTAAMSSYFAGRLVSFRPRIDLVMWRRFIIACVPFAVSAIMLVFRLRIDLLLLSVLRPPAEVGWYDAPVKLYELLLSLASLLGGLLTPAFVRDLRAGKTLASRLNAGMATMAILSAVAFAALFVCAEPIVTLLAGSDFAPAARPLRVIAAAAGITALTSMLRFAAIALEQQRRMSHADLAGVGLTIMALLFLVPRFGIMGAAYGRLAGDLLTLTVAASSLRSHLRPRLLGFVCIGAAAGACLEGLLYLAAEVKVPWFASLALCGSSVLASALCLPPVRRELALLTA